jgi:hypothetical protein
MSSEFFLKLNDRLPVIQSQLSDYYGYINLNSASGVTFVYRPAPTGTTIIRNATIVSGDIGLVQYSWVASDVSTPGVYNCEWRIGFNDGRQMTIPNDSYITFEILDNLG